MTGQRLWTEACSLGNLGTALGCIEVQHYLADLAHVRFAACAVDAALCCGAASAPSVEAELCRALAECEEAWQQSPSGVFAPPVLTVPEHAASQPEVQLCVALSFPYATLEYKQGVSACAHLSKSCIVDLAEGHHKLLLSHQAVPDAMCKVS